MRHACTNNVTDIASCAATCNAYIVVLVFLARRRTQNEKVFTLQSVEPGMGRRPACIFARIQPSRALIVAESCEIDRTVCRTHQIS